MITLMRSKACTSAKVVTRLFSQDLTESRKIPPFFRQDVHHLLRAITNRDPEKVHKSATYRSIGSGTPKSEEENRRQRKAKIELMTDEQLQRTQQNAPMLTHQRLQMPPVLPVREETEEVLEEEPRLERILPEGQKMVFTDISISDSISARTRSMVSRGADGCLRTVNWEDRDRLNSIYFPIEGQRVMPPLMFKDQFVRQLLLNKKHLYLLERACVQFEPDNPVFIRVRDLVFEDLLEKKEIYRLDSTRHFGPLTFFAVQNDLYHDTMFHYFLSEKQILSVVCYMQLMEKIGNFNFEAVSEVVPVLSMQVTLDIQSLSSTSTDLVLEATKALFEAALDNKIDLKISEKTMTVLNDLLPGPAEPVEFS